jgi:hypothetical protein
MNTTLDIQKRRQKKVQGIVHQYDGIVVVVELDMVGFSSTIQRGCTSLYRALKL